MSETNQNIYIILLKDKASSENILCLKPIATSEIHDFEVSCLLETSWLIYWFWQLRRPDVPFFGMKWGTFVGLLDKYLWHNSHYPYENHAGTAISQTTTKYGNYIAN